MDARIAVPYLHPLHLAEFTESGIDPEFLDDANVFSATKSQASLLMGWGKQKLIRPDGPYLMFGCYDPGGNLLGYRCKPPASGEHAPKYEQPSGVPPFAYFIGWEDVPEPEYVVVCEGEKKAIATWQTTGMPCIGLTGCWSWQAKREHKKQPRRLIDCLSSMDWSAREVAVLYDVDPLISSAVGHSEAELARVLTEHGATVHLCKLPALEDDDGNPSKNAADDHLVQFGAESLLNCIDRGRKSDQPVKLEDWRASIRDRRVGRIDSPEKPIHLDTSGAGSGKTYADLEYAVQLSFRRPTVRSLFSVPTHQQAGEIVEAAKRDGAQAAKYPRLIGPKGSEPSNCKNFDVAAAALNLGLSPSMAVCPTCEFAHGCPYHKGVQEAQRARVSVCTQDRAKYTIAGMAKDRDFIAIHEKAIDVLRPTISTSSSFNAVIEVLEECVQIGQLSINWAEDVARFYFDRLIDAARAIESARRDRSYEGEVTVQTVDPDYVPRDGQRRILDAARLLGHETMSETLRIAMGAAEGRMDTITVESVESPGKSPQRITTAYATANLPEFAAINIGDASVSASQISSIAKRTVVDITPHGRIEDIKPVIQIPRDVTCNVAPASGLAIVRGLMARYGEFRRWGIITHMWLRRCIDGTSKPAKGQSSTMHLEPRFRKRIARVSHFHAVDTRGSNVWIEQCDAIAVIGTPRVPADEINRRLAQLNMLHAIGTGGHWSSIGKNDDGSYGIHWSGVTESGKRRTVRHPGYQDRRWAEAFDSVVLAELEQCIGRGRTKMGNGIPVVVMTTLPVPGSVLSDDDAWLLDGPDFDILDQLAEGPKRAKELEIGLSRQSVTIRVKKLLEQGLISKSGYTISLSGRKFPDK